VSADHSMQLQNSPIISQVTNNLERALSNIASGNDADGWESYHFIRAKHEALAEEMGLSASEFAPIDDLLTSLQSLLQGVALTRETSPRLQARVVGYGELMSSHLGAARLRKAGIEAHRILAQEVLITVDDPKLSDADRYLEADVQPVVDPVRVSRFVPADTRVVITQGFLASTPAGELALLGRGGSDTSATLFGALLHAHRIEIWTDVHGMFTADPRLVPDARLLRHLSYREAQELAAMGAKVLHPRCLIPARVAGVPVEVRNTLDPQIYGAEGGVDMERLLQRTRIGVKAYDVAAPFAAGSDGYASDDSSHMPSKVFQPPRNKAHTVPSASAVEDGAAGSVASSVSGAELHIPTAARILAVARRQNVTMLTMTAFGMWGESGFLASVFAPFSAAGISVDLIATSQYAVSVTLDYIPGGPDGTPFQRVLFDLRKVCSVTVHHGCAVVSIVGRGLRTVLPELGGAMAALHGIPVHMLSESTEDLNLSFVVDGEHGDTLLKSLHRHLLSQPNTAAEQEGTSERVQFGMKWSKLIARAASPEAAPIKSPEPPAAASGGAPAEMPELSALPPPVPQLEDDGTVPRQWWTYGPRRHTLLQLLQFDGDNAYVYNISEVQQRAESLRDTVGAVDTWLYAAKANDHPAILKAMAAAGFGYECVSVNEIRHCIEHGTPDTRLVFTPNFCPISEYSEAFELGAEVIIDGPEVLEQAPDVFRGRSVGLRIDPNAGDGHHEKVVTSGPGQKFGCDESKLLLTARRAAEIECNIVGLHAHSGSGIRNPENWVRVADAHFQAAMQVDEEGNVAFPHLQWVNLGGGLGVEHGHDHATLAELVDAGDEATGPVVQSSIAVQAASLAAALELVAQRAAAHCPPLKLRLEPGRYCTSPAGVLLAKVTQVRTKGGRMYVGVSTGMNSLIRPALYGSYHSIVNLSRADMAPEVRVTVVGPICESGDVLGTDVTLPGGTAPGDVLLITNAGAYGRVMASRYNLREPAREVLLE